MSKNEPKEHGMIFTGQSIPALLNLAVGDEPKPIDPSKPFKYVTRRLIRRQPKDHIMTFVDANERPTGEYGICDFPRVISVHIRPPSPTGTVIWIRETWRTGIDFDILKPSQLGIHSDWDYHIFYEADDIDIYDEANDHLPTPGRRRNAMYLPRRLARDARFRVVDVRPEQVQQIAYNDALAEGFDFLTDEQQTDAGHVTDALAAFIELWERLHGKGNWAENPWVWRYELRRIR